MVQYGDIYWSLRDLASRQIKASNSTAAVKNSLSVTCFVESESEMIMLSALYSFNPSFSLEIVAVM
jgi:hypothetical protein